MLIISTQDGAACRIDIRARNNLENEANKFVATGLTMDHPDTFVGCSVMDDVGYKIARRQVDKVVAQVCASHDDVGVVEMHDCFVANKVSLES